MNLKIANATKDLFSVFTRKESRRRELSADDFIALLEPIEDSLYNFILKSLNFSEDAKDVYQDAVMRGMKYLKSYNTELSFKTWIFTVANNQIRHHFKKNKNNPETLEDNTVSKDIDDCADKERIEAIYRNAAKLKPKQREVFFLFYHNGVSINEIHEITGLKPGNIKFILNQSRESIKSDMGVKND
ncbi:MAG: sigma-70 family RNA polymerase sigma factor [bacterium]|nr:sigma-70 family RNA polymerase sigma factor [bacterium]